MTELESAYDKSRVLKEVIEIAVGKAAVLNSVLNSEMSKSLLDMLESIQKLYPVTARNFIIGQVLLENPMKEPLYIGFSDHEQMLKITVRATQIESKPSKKKWYHF